MDTQIALVEADQGIAIVPSFGLPVARQRRRVKHRVINPEIHLLFHQISDRGRKRPGSAEEFAGFLRTYISSWADRSTQAAGREIDDLMTVPRSRPA